MKYEIEKIQEKLRLKLKSSRFSHTLGVQYTSACLAMRYAEDVEAAEIAGLLHDCAKQLSDEKRLEICFENHIPVTDIERKYPFLLHGKVGAYYAKTKYCIDNEDILNAIAHLTTGRPAMSMLEKIVFTADYIEPGRDQAPNLEKLRQTAFTDIDLAVCLILRQTLEYLDKTGTETDHQTVKTYEYYKNFLEVRKHG